MSSLVQSEIMIYRIDKDSAYNITQCSQFFCLSQKTNVGFDEKLKIHSYYAAIALCCHTAPYSTEIMMLVLPERVKCGNAAATCGRK